MRFVNTRLLILWLLAEGPLHGYRVRKILSAPAFDFWFTIEDASIYAMLRSLVKQGLAESIANEPGEKGRPRQRYRITRQGRTALREDLETAWTTVGSDTSPILAALATMDEFERSEINGFLTARAAELRIRQAELRQLEKGAPSALLARRERALLTAELAWLQSELDDKK